MFTAIHAELAKEVRRRAGRSAQPTAAIIDAQSIKAAGHQGPGGPR
ncbi:hypothetical protein [Streptomyces sp. NBC_00273]|nr:hypothetical protein [Streptomyces sp. NBC_00273]